MNHSSRKADRESLILRAVWMLLFFLAWQLAELVLLVVVLLQFVLRVTKGQPDAGLQGFGDSLSQYVAQIGRYATFNTEHKPWPLSDWPAPRAADSELCAQTPPQTPPKTEEPTA
ncbi:DUF4389 domain-containing protein [Stutzerimonas stutzeri]|uniref:DUF4389 domain-containing protein n=1 Tax=Stutzerimonas sp. S1 TaxID=3030652 RepID=UPI002224F2C1|nr:DUF4389 domain-containing protein [Stutzerimonas sp. S1]MCW3147927.1 DUF4389 domain-containing protein [Stutzerimonas sp. S1]